jgi:hypothetical protein
MPKVVRLKITPKRAFWIQILGILLLFCISVVAHVLEHFWKGTQTLYVLWIENNDVSIATWYSSVLLLCSSILLIVIATIKTRYKDHYTLHWGALSGIFLLLSIDEVARLHEVILGEVGTVLSSSVGFTPVGFLYFIWVIPGAVFTLIVLLVFLRFLFHLPRKTMILFLGVGAFYVGASLGLEMLDAKIYYEREAGADVARVLLAIETIEEMLEMLSIVVFNCALLSYIGSYVKGITVQIYE